MYIILRLYKLFCKYVKIFGAAEVRINSFCLLWCSVALYGPGDDTTTDGGAPV